MQTRAESAPEPRQETSPSISPVREFWFDPSHLQKDAAESGLFEQSRTYAEQLFWAEEAEVTDFHPTLTLIS